MPRSRTLLRKARASGQNLDLGAWQPTGRPPGAGHVHRSVPGIRIRSVRGARRKGTVSGRNFGFGAWQLTGSAPGAVLNPVPDLTTWASAGFQVPKWCRCPCRHLVGRMAAGKRPHQMRAAEQGEYFPSRCWHQSLLQARSPWVASLRIRRPLGPAELSPTGPAE